MRKKNIESMKGNLGAISLVVLAVVLIIGTIVFFSIWNQLNVSQGSNRIINNTLNNISVLFMSGIQLLGVGLIIVPAVIVLGYVFMIRE